MAGVLGVNGVQGVPVYQDAVVFLVVAMLLAMALVAVVARTVIRGRALRRRLEAIATRLDTTDAPRHQAGLEELLGRLEGGAVESPVGVSESPVGSDAGVVAERFGLALDAVAQGVVVCDDRGKVLYRNPAASVLLRPTDPDPRTTEAFGAVLSAALDGRTVSRDIEIPGPPPRSLQLAGLPLDADHRSIGAAIVVDDRTGDRAAELTRREILSDLARELTEPMVALGLVADSLQAEEDPAVRARFVERAKAEAQRARHVLDDLAELSRLVTERPRPPEKVAMAEVLSRAIDQVEAVAGRRMVTVVAPVVPDNAVLIGDPHQMDVAVAKLLEHVVLGSRTGGKVELAVRVDRSMCELEARQAGLSLAGARPPGLAMSLVEQAARNLGGTLVHESDSHTGLCCLRLPAEVADPERVSRDGA